MLNRLIKANATEALIFLNFSVTTCDIKIFLIIFLGEKNMYMSQHFATLDTLLGYMYTYDGIFI